MAMDVATIDRLREELPVQPVSYDLAGREAGLVVVDVIDGWCTPGAGPLAPATPEAGIERMVEVNGGLARSFLRRRRAVLALVNGSTRPGGETLVPALRWLEDEPDATVLRTDCVNGFVGGIEAVHHGTHGTSRNRVVDWVNAHRLQTVLVGGMCTDGSVMEFVLTMLSARNHGLMPTLQDVVVVEPATATYDLPGQVAGERTLPASAAHPRLPTHHMGLYLMAAGGAVLAGKVAGV